jgi:diguanylate cyclase (GGDEF)-like protein
MLVSLFLSAAGMAAGSALESAPAEVDLTTAHQIHALSSAQAARSLPGHLHGVVTVATTTDSDFFLQDATGGVFIFSTLQTPRLEPGMEVDIRGVTAPGQFAPILNVRSITVLGRKPLPPARIFQWDELAGGKQDCNWIAIRGLIHSLSIRHQSNPTLLTMQVDTGSGNLVSVFVYNFPASGWEYLRGAIVQIKGVGGAAFNSRRQFIAPRLYISNLDQLQVEQPAPADPFALPTRTIDSLLQFGDAWGIVEQVKVRGIVTFSDPAEGLYLQDGNSGVYVQTPQRLSVELGSVVEAAGFPESGAYSPILSNAVYRIVGQAPPISPFSVQAANMIGSEVAGIPIPAYDALLVRTKGQLVEVIPGSAQDQLILRDGVKLFTAHLPHTGNSPRMPLAGALLEVNGICRTQVDRNHEARSFELLLRSPADIQVLENIPWWNLRRDGWLLAGLPFALLASFAAWTVYRRQREMHALAMTDPLTGLYNRRAFFLLAEHQWQAALRRDAPLLLFFLDVDRFKQINDSFGHKEGDRALQTLAEVLRECFRGTDIIARMGGDEFAVLFDAGTGSRSLIGERLNEAVARANRQDGQRFQLSLSVGTLVCDASLSDFSMDELVSRADALMYHQKEERRKKAS